MSNEQCKRCRSHAINHNQHDRDGSDPDLCDVCYWRKRAENNLTWHNADESESKLLSILAVIHRDGGHYTGEHGVDRSVKDAMDIISKLLIIHDSKG